MFTPETLAPAGSEELTSRRELQERGEAMGTVGSGKLGSQSPELVAEPGQPQGPGDSPSSAPSITSFPLNQDPRHKTVTPGQLMRGHVQ